MPSKAHKTCLLIIGMHRSGTSAIAGSMSIAGYNVGKNIMSAKDDNEKGFFENKSIYDFNQNILNQLQLSWHQTIFPEIRWWQDEQFIPLKQELAHIIKNEFGDAQNILIKDPRISILLPLYLEVLEHIQITPKIIIAIRNPLEVAASLKKRNEFSHSKSMLLWMDTTLKAIDYSKSLTHSILHFDAFLEKPITHIKQIDQLLSLEFTLNEQTKTQIENFVEKKLKHHSSPTELNEHHQLIKQLYHLLLHNKSFPLKPNDWSSISAIRKEFYANYFFYQGIDVPNIIKLQTIDVYGNQNEYTSSFESIRTNFNIEIAPSQPITAFQILPPSQRIALKITSVTILTQNKINIVDLKMETNAEIQSEQGILLFETENSLIKFHLPEASRVKSISFQITFAAFNHSVYGLSVKERNRYENQLLGLLELEKKRVSESIRKRNELTEELQQKQQSQIQKYNDILNQLQIKNAALQANNNLAEENLKIIRQSLSWKLARILTWPIRIFEQSPTQKSDDR